MAKTPDLSTMRVVPPGEMERYRAAFPANFREWCRLRSINDAEEYIGRRYMGFAGVALYVDRVGADRCRIPPTPPDHARAAELLEALRPLWMSFCVGPWYAEAYLRHARGWLDEAGPAFDRTRADARRRLLNRLFGRRDWKTFDGGFLLDKESAFALCGAFRDFGIGTGKEVQMVSMSAPLGVHINHHGYLGFETRSPAIKQFLRAGLESIGLPTFGSVEWEDTASGSATG